MESLTSLLSLPFKFWKKDEKHIAELLHPMQPEAEYSLLLADLGHHFWLLKIGNDFFCRITMIIYVTLRRLQTSFLKPCSGPIEMFGVM